MSQKPSPSASVRWAEMMPPEQWAVFQSACAASRQSGVPILMGGAMALASYTGRWRNTKDIDVFVRDGQQPAIITALQADGFVDYFDQQPYDRSWIFRGFRDGVILDIIWRLPNHRVLVDEAWFDLARPVTLRGERHFAMPLEELIRVKLYVMQRDRCDWVDILNALAGSVELIDWEHLIARTGREFPLLQAVLHVFTWLAPARAQQIPGPIRQQFALTIAETDDLAAMEQRRARLLDSRPWYAVLQPEDKPLEV